MKTYFKLYKYFFLIALFICGVTPKLHSSDRSGVVYTLDYVGRFGDQLLNYIKAFYLSWKYDLTLWYKPFDYSDQLMLSRIHLDHFDSQTQDKYLRVFKLSSNSDINLMNEVIKELELDTKNTLYEIPFYFPGQEWEEEMFHQKLAEMIKPIKPLDLVKIPPHYISVAVHFRSKNNGFDSQSVVESMPSKFPPLSFYINGIQEISKLFENKPLYVYIFTDDPEPIKVRERFYNTLQDNNNVLIECRASHNKHDLNVLEDFFSMIQFDCLIYPCSAYSICAAAISAPLVEITTPGWGIYSKDHNGNIVIDNLIKVRLEKKKKVIKREIITIKILSNAADSACSP